MHKEEPKQHSRLHAACLVAPKQSLRDVRVSAKSMNGHLLNSMMRGEQSELGMDREMLVNSTSPESPSAQEQEPERKVGGNK